MHTNHEILIAAILVEAGRIANNLLEVDSSDDFKRVKTIDKGCIMVAVDELAMVKKYLEENNVFQE